MKARTLTNDPEVAAALEGLTRAEIESALAGRGYLHLTGTQRLAIKFVGRVRAGLLADPAEPASA